jgi:hypothetical protein
MYKDMLITLAFIATGAVIVQIVAFSILRYFGCI